MPNKIKFLTDILDSSGNAILSRDDICYSLLDILKALYGEALFVIPRGTTEITAEVYKENNNILKTVFIPATVSKIGEGAFSNSTSLSNVVIPNSVTSIERDAFANCTKLQSICVDTDNTVYKAIDGNLYSKDGTVLVAYAIGKTDTSFVIPNGVITVDKCAFRSCNNLTSVEIPDTTTTLEFYALANCLNLTDVKIGNSVETIARGVFYNCDKLKKITIPDSTGTIGELAFFGCSNLAAVEIGSNVDTIGKEAFSYCNNLKKIIFNGTKTQWKSIISKESDWKANTGIFVIYCTDGILNKEGEAPSKFTVTAANRDVVGYTGVENEKLVIPRIATYNNTIYEVTSIGYQAFSSCPYLTSVTIPNSVISIDKQAFRYCYNLTSITIPGSVATVGEYAFENCNNLRGVYIYDIAAWCNIAFADSSANPLWYATNLYLIKNDSTELITELVIPSSVTSIGDYAFENCCSLTSVTIPDSVTTIGNEAFEFCTNLTNVTIPSSVTSIGNYAFLYCTNLTNITFNGTEAQWNSITKGIDWNDHVAADCKVTFVGNNS